MITTKLGGSKAKQLLSIVLSNDTVSRRISDTAENFNQQLI